MSPKKSAGRKAAQTKKSGAAAKKAAATRKHRAAGIKAAAKRKHRAAGKKAKATLEAKKPPQSVVALPAPTMPELPTSIDRTEEMPKATPETSATAAETSEPSSNPDASLKADIEALRNTRWGRR